DPVAVERPDAPGGPARRPPARVVAHARRARPRPAGLRQPGSRPPARAGRRPGRRRLFLAGAARALPRARPPRPWLLGPRPRPRPGRLPAGVTRVWPLPAAAGKPTSCRDRRPDEEARRR